MAVVRKNEILDFRSQGYSFQKIADIYGVSRQHIHQVIKVNTPSNRIPDYISACIYPNLKKWFIENSYTSIDLAKHIGVTRQSVYSKFKGTEDFKGKELTALKRLTGLTIDKILEPPHEPTP